MRAIKCLLIMATVVFLFKINRRRTENSLQIFYRLARTRGAHGSSNFEDKNSDFINSVARTLLSRKTPLVIFETH